MLRVHFLQCAAHPSGQLNGDFLPMGPGDVHSPRKEEGLFSFRKARAVEGARLEFERRPQDFHSMLLPKVLPEALLILGDSRAELGHLPEEVLHAAGGLE